MSVPWRPGGTGSGGARGRRWRGLPSLWRSRQSSKRPLAWTGVRDHVQPRRSPRERAQDPRVSVCAQTLADPPGRVPVCRPPARGCTPRGIDAPASRRVTECAGPASVRCDDLPHTRRAIHRWLDVVNGLVRPPSVRRRTFYAAPDRADGCDSRLGRGRGGHMAADDDPGAGMPRHDPDQELLTPDFELTLPARAENVAVVRHAFGGLGDALDVPDHALADVKLAVTEACTNVVVHAYPDGEGSMAVSAGLRDGALTVIVADEGRGILPRPDSPGLGLGLPLIATLASSLELGTNDREETEVRMTFELDRRPEGDPA
ncbi:ATP-binding protein [Baekduia soli]|uniref:ATP-binding protein n=2 Tax=Baekduia soli TaxID=496014 RepID=A0A5B8UAD9_9ACTN|nr:ATP-binding protein [Baekduia soli]